MSGNGSGSELRENNEKIVKLMSLLKQQRQEMNYLIQKQQEEKIRIQNEIEKLTFKLSLLTKSLNQRLLAKDNYDKTIKEIEENYMNLVAESGKLLTCLTKEVHDLEQIMDKRTSTGSGSHPRSKTASMEPIREPSREAPQKENLTSETIDPLPEKLDDNETVTDYENQPSINEEDDEPTKPASATQSDIDTLMDLDQSQNIGASPRKTSADQSDATLPYKDLENYKNPYNKPPPIKNDDADFEIQTFRDAYGRQHAPQSPPHSDVESKPTRKLSNGRRNSRRKSDS